MAFIHTSRTRRNRPNGRPVYLRDHEGRETRISDERKADELLKYKRWDTNPVIIPTGQDSKE